VRAEWLKDHQKEAQGVVNALVGTLAWMKSHTAADVADVMPKDFVSNQLVSKDEYIAALQADWGQFNLDLLGSPIELDEGWLLFTHGVGPVRRYSIGAALLDKADPSRVLARSREPLVYPDPSQREGYVPNVVYTCGAIRHGERIVLPYAVSDTFANFATIKVQALLGAMESTRSLST
jgi:predicted GH43/DUF377 family glycosyl hydrolase